MRSSQAGPRPRATQRVRRLAGGVVAALVLPATLLASVVALPGQASASVAEPGLVELTGMRTEYSSTFVAPDGSKKTSISARPKNYLDAATGSWRPIDSSLVSSGIGRYRNAANAFSVEFAKLPATAVSVRTSDGTLTMTPLGASSLGGVSVAGDTITYRDAWPGADLRYRVEPDGVKEDIVLRSRPAVSRFDFAMTGSGLAVRGDGGIDLVDSAWDGWAISPPEVFDKAGAPVAAAAPRFSVTGGTTASTVGIEVDRQWLAAQPDSAFPITIDPTLHRVGGSPSRSYKSDGAVCDPCPMKVGNPNEPNRWVSWRGVVHFPYSNLYGKRITSASIHLWNLTRGTANANWIDLYQGGWDWPTLHGGLLANSYSETDFWFSGEALRDFYQRHVDARSGGANMKFLVMDQNGVYSYKELNHFELDLWWEEPAPPPNQAPYTPYGLDPANGAQTNTTPALSAVFDDPDNGEGGRVEFEVYDDATGAQVQWGRGSDTGDGGRSSWTVPAGVLQEGRTYRWRGIAVDNRGAGSGWSGFHTFTTATTNRAPAQPTDLQPADGATGQSKTLTLSGVFSDSGDNGVLDFEVYDASGVNRVTNGSGNDVPSGSRSQWAVPSGALQAETAYRWRARARDRSGLASEWTAMRGFSTAQDPPPPPPPPQVMWGVDSADNAQDLWEGVNSRYGKPEFWGRYLGGSYAMTAEEVSFLHQHNVPILVVDQDFANVPNNDTLRGYDTGHRSGLHAADKATALGMPTSVAIHANVESGTNIDAAFIRGWYEGLSSRGYKVGYYANLSPTTSNFRGPFCDAVQANPAVGSSLLWSSTPSSNNRTGPSDKPAYNPHDRPCGERSGQNAEIWQYALAGSGGGPSIDTNEMLGAYAESLFRQRAQASRSAGMSSPPVPPGDPVIAQKFLADSLTFANAVAANPAGYLVDLRLWTVRAAAVPDLAEAPDATWVQAYLAWVAADPVGYATEWQTFLQTQVPGAEVPSTDPAWLLAYANWTVGLVYDATGGVT